MKIMNGIVRNLTWIFILFHFNQNSIESKFHWNWTLIELNSKWKFYEFGLHIFQIEYSLVLDMYFDHSQIVFFLLIHTLVLSSHKTIIVSSTTDLFLFAFEKMIGISSIPLIILNILGNGVNSLENLAPNYTTFVYTLYGMESNLTKKWLCSTHIRRITNHWFVLYKLFFNQNNFLHPFFYIVLNLLSLLWLFYKVSIQHLLPCMSNKSIPHFIVNLWTSYDPTSSNSIESTYFKRVWTNLVESTWS